MQTTSCRHSAAQRRSFIPIHMDNDQRPQAQLKILNRSTLMHQRQTNLSILALTIAMAMTLVSSACAQNTFSQLQFINDTDATIRIQAAQGSASNGFAPRIARPRSQIQLAVAPGNLILDLIAFRTAPNRVHRVMVEVSPDENAYFRFTAQRIGLYLLEDANSLAAIPSLPSALPNQSQTNKIAEADFTDPKIACQPSLNDWDGVALWQTQAHVQYYRRVGGYLCGLDRQDVYLIGATYAHYVCMKGWIDCIRREAGDFELLPKIYTSEISDTPLRIAQVDDPTAFYVETQEIIGLDEPPLVANMTSYIASNVTNSSPKCPQGYRLHYQGFCINVADELADDRNKSVRTVEPQR